MGNKQFHDIMHYAVGFTGCYKVPDDMEIECTA